VSDDVNDKQDNSTDEEYETSDGGDFELFEVPPEVDPNRFGPIPVVPSEETAIDHALSDDRPADHVPPDHDPTGQAPPPDDLDETDDELVGDESISAIFGFDPLDDSDRPVAKSVSVEKDPEPDSPANSGADLPHWTEPATGIVPAVIAGDDQSGSVSEVAGPRWHGEGPQWAGDDLEAVFADEEGVSGTKRVTIQDDHQRPEIPSAAGAPQRHSESPARPGTPAAQPQPAVDSGERDLVQAVLLGLALAGVAALAFWLGAVPTLILVAVAAAVAAAELFQAMRKAGLHPATLLGITAAVALPLATYNRGEAGFVLVMALAVVFGALWYLVGADTHRPALNIGLTMLGITWIGGMAAFAALLVRADQIPVLLAAVLVTVASDTGAYAGGRSLGVHPFHPASPNKTWEGFIVGLIAAVVVGFVIGVLEISVFSGNLVNAVIFGLVCGILAPIGDLTESLVKRDLGVKDMGSILPGHGGVLDRLDGLLFVLPGAYYLGRVLDLF